MEGIEELEGVRRGDDGFVRDRVCIRLTKTAFAVQSGEDSAALGFLRRRRCLEFGLFELLGRLSALNAVHFGNVHDEGSVVMVVMMIIVVVVVVILQKGSEWIGKG